MSRNEVNLKDIIWVIGIKEKDDKKIFKAIPYVIKKTIKGYEDLVDLTELWITSCNGKVTKEDIVKKFEKVHEAKAIKIIKSEEAIKSYILNHENQFKDDIESINSWSIDQSIKNYCEKTILNKEEGSILIREMREGVKVRYCDVCKEAEKFKEYFIESYL